jgi:hypothetical protein
VRDLQGEPIAGAEVLSEASERYDETDDEGRYLLNSQPAAELSMVVSAPGYQTERLVVPDGEAGVDERVDVRLEPGTLPAGRVVDPAGRAVRRATVTCEDEEDGPEAETDDRGRFELGDEALGCPARARHPDFAASAPRTLKAGPDNRLMLAEPGAIRGTVVDGEGRPVTTFLVAVERFVDDRGQPQSSSYRQTFSHPQGRFTISRLDAGSYVLSIQRRGLAVETKPLKVTPGEAPTRVRVAME